MTEFELKFEIPPARLKNVVVAMRESKAVRQRLQACYFDTPDGALARCGIVVRLRKEGKHWVQTAKGPTADLLERLEHNADLPLQSARTMPALDLLRHRGTPIGKLIDKALGLKPSESYPSLDLLYGTDVQRITRRITSGESVVEVSLDQGRVFCNANSQAICELEVELKEGVPLDAVTLARQWCAAHGLWISTIAKSMKGQRLSSTPAFVTVLPATAPHFSRHASGHDMITAVAKACLGQMLPNMSELAGGSKHPDHIHQLRVGIRKLRTALHELGDWTNAIDPAWEAALIPAFRALGAHRDHGHLALVLQPQWLAAGGPCLRFDAAASDIPDVGKAVRAPEFQDALLGLLAFVHRDTPRALDKREALKKEISARLGKLHKRALREGKKFCELDQTQQHSLRKRFKRLRYLMEFSAPLYTARKGDHMTAALKPLQDALGLYNDELTALHTLGVMVADDPRAWFGIGWLTARRERNAMRCLEEIKNLADIKPFWSP